MTLQAQPAQTGIQKLVISFYQEALHGSASFDSEVEHVPFDIVSL